MMRNRTDPTKVNQTETRGKTKPFQGQENKVGDDSVDQMFSGHSTLVKMPHFHSSKIRVDTDTYSHNIE